MATVVRSPRSDRWSALLIYLASGLVGGTSGAVYAILTIKWHSDAETLTNPFLYSGPLGALAAAVAGGVLAGWFVAALVLSRAPGRLRCPRCGTPNDRYATSCVACLLSFG